MWQLVTAYASPCLLHPEIFLHHHRDSSLLFFAFAFGASVLVYLVALASAIGTLDHDLSDDPPKAEASITRITKNPHHPSGIKTEPAGMSLMLAIWK